MKKLLLVVLLMFGYSGANAAMELHMKSDSGDYIGAGALYDYYDTDLSYSFNQTGDVLTINVNNSVDYWTLRFYVPNVIDIGPHFDAARYPFQGPQNTGLSVSGNGRGCNTLLGNFVVYEHATVAGVPMLSLDFEQHCEGVAAALRGSFRVNSLIPVPAINPVAYAGRDGIVNEGASITLDASQSYSPQALPYSVAWTQILGSPVTIVAPDQAVTSFMTPAKVGLGGEDFAFAATITDGAGKQSVDQVLFHVASKSDPRTYISMSSEAGDYIGLGKNWYFDPTTTVISTTPVSTYGITVNLNAGPLWTLSFAAPKASPLAPGQYDNATRFPFEDASMPGLSVSGDSRGCNSLTGSFKVISVNVANNQFAADFIQHCEGNTPALTGEVRVNAVDPSVPNANAGPGQTVKEFDLVSLDGSASSDSGGSILTYAWTQSDGPAVVLSDPSAVQPTFIAPPLQSGMTSDTLSFALTVEDDQGFMAKSEVTLTLLPGNHPPIANDDQASTYKKQSVDIAVLDNDVDDVQLDVSSVSIVNPPANGRVYVQSNGVVTYRPRRGFIGIDVFSYNVKDNTGAVSNTALVTVTVLPSP